MTYDQGHGLSQKQELLSDSDGTRAWQTHLSQLAAFKMTSELIPPSYKVTIDQPFWWG